MVPLGRRKIAIAMSCRIIPAMALSSLKSLFCELEEWTEPALSTQRDLFTPPTRPPLLELPVFWFLMDEYVKKKFSPNRPFSSRKKIVTLSSHSAAILGRHPQCVHQGTNRFRRSLSRRGRKTRALDLVTGSGLEKGEGNCKFCSIDFWKCISPCSSLTGGGHLWGSADGGLNWHSNNLGLGRGDWVATAGLIAPGPSCRFHGKNSYFHFQKK